MEIANKLRELRVKKDVKQTEVAAAINIVSKAISNYELGVNLPEYDVLIKLANYYNVSIDYLLDNSPTKMSWQDANSELEFSDHKMSMLKFNEMVKDLDKPDRDGLLYILQVLRNQTKYQNIKKNK